MSEMTMRERVARAIAVADMEDYEDAPHLYDAMGEAAIKAMREPTDAMAEAAYEVVEMSDAWCIEDDTHWKRSFTAAIDNASAEAPPLAVPAAAPGRP